MRKIAQSELWIVPKTGVDSVSRKDIAHFDLPDHEQVPPSHLNFYGHLQDIFPLKNSDFIFIDQAIPKLFFKSFPKTFKMQSLIPDLRRTLKVIASENPELSRKIGGVAKILDDERQLLELLQHYRSALFQG